MQEGQAHEPMFAHLPRCGAKTRSGKPCRRPRGPRNRRCHLHGGAPGSGAQLGNQNALKHGFYSGRMLALQRAAAELLRNSRDLIEEASDVECRLESSL